MALKVTKDMVRLACASDPSITDARVKAVLAELDGEGVREMMQDEPPGRRPYGMRPQDSHGLRTARLAHSYLFGRGQETSTGLHRRECCSTAFWEDVCKLRVETKGRRNGI